MLTDIIHVLPSDYCCCRECHRYSSANYKLVAKVVAMRNLSALSDVHSMATNRPLTMLYVTNYLPFRRIIAVRCHSLSMHSHHCCRMTWHCHSTWSTCRQHVTRKYWRLADCFDDVVVVFVAARRASANRREDNVRGRESN